MASYWTATEPSRTYCTYHMYGAWGKLKSDKVYMETYTNYNNIMGIDWKWTSRHTCVLTTEICIDMNILKLILRIPAWVLNQVYRKKMNKSISRYLWKIQYKRSRYEPYRLSKLDIGFRTWFGVKRDLDHPMITSSPHWALMIYDDGRFKVWSKCWLFLFIYVSF